MSCLLTRHDFYQLFPVLSFYPQIKTTCISTPPRPATLQKTKKPYTPVISAIGTNDNAPYLRVTFDIQNSTASSSEKLQVIEHRGLRTQFQATRICPQRRHEKFSTLSAALGSFSFRAHGKSSFQLLLPSCSVPAKY